MAGKLRRQFQYAVAPGLCLVTAKIPIGTAGVVGTIDGRGIKSVTRAASGQYTINFNDKYLGMASFAGHVDVNNGNATAPTAADGYLVQLAGDWSDNTIGTSVNGGDGYAKIETVTHAGSNTDALKCDILVTFWMKTSEQS